MSVNTNDFVTQRKHSGPLRHLIEVALFSLDWIGPQFDRTLGVAQRA